MKTLTTAELNRLEEALLDAFPGVVELDRLLRSDPLDKRFDDLASKYEPLRDAVVKIVFKAGDQGWALQLLEVAIARRPDNAALRTLHDSLPESADAPPERSRGNRPSLTCGRGLQWNEVCQCAPARVHNVILIHGHADQDPSHFRERIHVHLDVRPTRSIYAIDWGETIPLSQDHFHHVLATSLKADASRLREAIAARLAGQDLIVLHPSIRADIECEELLRYYTMYLPELVAGANGDNRLKCVQPIEWADSGRGFLSRIGLGDDAPQGRDAAATFVSELQAREHPLLPIAELDELTTVTPKEMSDFAKYSGLPTEKRKRLLQRVGTVPQVSKVIFKEIDRYWWSEVQAAP